MLYDLGKKTLLLASCSFLSAVAAATPLLHITSVTVFPDLPRASTTFSTVIDFQATQTLRHWALGFYWPRTIKQLGAINPDLSMRLCQGSQHCVPLQMVSHGNSANFIGTGYAQLITPINAQVRLQAGARYQIKLQHSNQGLPGNYSSMPQNFFVVQGIKTPTPVVSAIPTSMGIFHLGGYEQTHVDQEIAAHRQQILAHSMPLSTAPEQQFIQRNQLIPTPAHIEVTPDSAAFTVPPLLGVSYQQQGSIAERVQVINGYLHKLGLHIALVNHPRSKPSDISIDIKNTAFFQQHPSGYRIAITAHHISLIAAHNSGVFYGLITLSQLLYHHPHHLPAVIITDYPRFRYRGVLLDSARHYFTVTQIKQLLDAMAAQKLNVLHWHLSDDEGFRLHLATLHAIENHRASTRGFVVGLSNPATMFSQANLDLSNHYQQSPHGILLQPHYAHADTVYGGYYRRTQIRALIHYANVRNITLIPELDFPGHARALVQAAPRIFHNPHDHSQYISVQGYSHDVLPICAFNGTNLFSLTMLRIIRDTTAWFGHQTTALYQREFSVGGDEVSANAWTHDASCTGTWQALTALQKSIRFFSNLSRALPNINLSGWQQSVQRDDGNLDLNSMPANRIGHVWVWNTTAHGIKQAQTLIQHGYPTVLTFADDSYFDLAYSPDKWSPGFTWATPFSDTASALKLALDASRVEQGITAHHHRYLSGVEGTLWSENLMNFRHLGYMALPKMLGLAEAAWAPGVVTHDLSTRHIATLSLAQRLRGNAYVQRISGMQTNVHAMILNLSD